MPDSVNFITDNPALSEFNRAQRLAQQQQQGDLQLQSTLMKNTLDTAMAPSKLRQMNAETNLAETKAKYAGPLAQAEIAQRGAATRASNAAATNAEMQGFYKSLDYLNSGDIESAKAVAAQTGHPLPDVVVNNASLRATVTAVAKRAQELYPSRPAAQQAYIKSQMDVLHQQVQSGQHPDAVMQPYTMPPGAPPVPDETQKPVIVGPGYRLVDPTTGKVIYQNNASGFEDTTIATMAYQALRGDRSVFQNLGRGNQGYENLARIRNKMVQIGRAEGRSEQDIAQRIAEANQQYAGDTAYQRTAGTYGARVETATNEVSQLMPQALDASQKLPRGAWVPINRLVQRFEAGTSDPNYYDFAFANWSLMNAYARAINPTGVPRLEDKNHALNLLSTATSPETYQRVLKRMQMEVEASQNAVARTRAGRQAPGTQFNGAAPTPAGGVPPRPATVPDGSAYSPSRNMWRDPQGNLYGPDGTPARE